MAWHELTRVKNWNWKTSQAVTWAEALSVHTKAGMKFGNSRLITWFFTVAVDCTLKAFCFSLNPVPFKIRTYSWSQETALSLAVQLNLGFFPELLPFVHLLLLGYKTGPLLFLSESDMRGMDSPYARQHLCHHDEMMNCFLFSSWKSRTEQETDMRHNQFYPWRSYYTNNEAECLQF